MNLIQDTEAALKLKRYYDQGSFIVQKPKLKHQSTDVKFVVKIVKIADHVAQRRFQEEIEMMLNLTIRPRLIEYFQTSKFGYIVEEYISGPTLRQFIAATPFNWSHVIKLTEMLVQVHSLGIVHGDCHADNVIVSGLEFVLIDYGMAQKRVQSTIEPWLDFIQLIQDIQDLILQKQLKIKKSNRL